MPLLQQVGGVIMANMRQHCAPMARGIINMLLLVLYLLVLASTLLTGMLLNRAQALLAYIDAPPPGMPPCRPKAVRLLRCTGITIFRLLLLAFIVGMHVLLHGLELIFEDIERYGAHKEQDDIVVEHHPPPPAAIVAIDLNKQFVVAPPRYQRFYTCALPPTPKSKRKSNRSRPNRALISRSQQHLLFAYAAYLNKSWWLWDFNNAARFAVSTTLYLHNWKGVSIAHAELLDNGEGVFKVQVVVNSGLMMSERLSKPGILDAPSASYIASGTQDVTFGMATTSHNGAPNTSGTLPTSGNATPVHGSMHVHIITSQRAVNNVQFNTGTLPVYPAGFVSVRAGADVEKGFILLRTHSIMADKESQTPQITGECTVLYQSTVITFLDPKPMTQAWHIEKSTIPHTPRFSQALVPLNTTVSSYEAHLSGRQSAKRFWKSLGDIDRAYYSRRVNQYARDRKKYKSCKLMFDGLLEAYPWRPSLASRHPTWETCEDEFSKNAMFMIRFCNITAHYQAWVDLKVSKAALDISELWIKTHIVPEISSMLAWDRKVAARKAERAAYQSAMRIEDEELTILGRREALRKAANERAGYVPTTEKYVAMEAAKTKAYENDVDEVTGFRPGTHVILIVDEDDEAPNGVRINEFWKAQIKAPRQDIVSYHDNDLERKPKGDFPPMFAHLWHFEADSFPREFVRYGEQESKGRSRRTSAEDLAAVREELKKPYEAEIQEVKNKSFSELLELFSSMLMEDVDGCICGIDTCQACHPTPSEHVPDPVRESWDLDDEFGMDIDWSAADSMHGEKRKPLQAEGDGSVANGESRKRGRFEAKIVKYNQPGYTYLVVIPDTMDVMKVVNFGNFIVEGWNGQFHAWDKTYTMVDAPDIIYVDPDIVMPDVLDFLPRILAPPNKRKAATAGLDKRQGEQTKRVCGARDIPHRVLPVLGKRKFDDDGDEESKQSKPAVYEDERPIKRLKTSHPAVENLPSSA